MNRFAKKLIRNVCGVKKSIENLRRTRRFSNLKLDYYNIFPFCPKSVVVHSQSDPQTSSKHCLTPPNTWPDW